MTIRTGILALSAVALLTAGCRDRDTGPLVVSVIGDAPALINPNLQTVTPPTAFLLSATAQGLVRFDASGQIEPALAQSWTITDDGLSYIFRINRLTWANGRPVTTTEVAARLQAANSRASRNALKPLLGVVTEIRPMTDRVIEIRLKAPRPNFLQLLAQPDMAIIRSGGTGPYAAEPTTGGAMRLRPRPRDDEEDEPIDEEVAVSEILLRGEPAARAVARFQNETAALVLGGTAGDLPIARAAEPPAAALRFDPVVGMFGLEFVRSSDILEDVEIRRALSMAIDREAIVAALGVPNLAPRSVLVPAGIRELPRPVSPAWSADPLPIRRAAAAAIIDRLAEAEPTLRIAMPDLPGYRLLFAYLKRDWRAIGVNLERVGPTQRADLRLIDEVAPASLATWYLRHFTCEASPICNAEADIQLEAARNTQSMTERQQFLTEADRLLMESVTFIPIAGPARWSLVSPRVTGFQPNAFGRHFAGALVRPRR